MSMTSEKIQAPKPVGKFMLVMQRWHHIWHGEAQHTEPRMPMVKLYSEETVLSLLAERDADKALIAEQVKQIDELEDIRAASERLVRCKGRYHSEQNYRSLAALFGVSAPDLPPLDSEASTVTVKLPRDITHVTNKYFEDGRDAVLEAIESQLAAAGITLDVGE